MTMAWRATMKMRRNFEQLFDVTIQPLLFTAMFAGIFGGAISGSVEDYLPMIIPGLVGQTVLTACVATGVQLREDMDKGVFDRFKVLPIARIAPLAGPMVADMLRYLIASTLTFATGIVLGYRPGGGVPGVVGAILLAIVAGWSLAWIFTWFGTVGRSAQGVQAISLMVMFPLTFLSNAFVPTDTMPPWLQAFAERSTRSRTSSPRSATWPTTARSPRRSAGPCSAARSSSRSSPRCRCGASPGRCDRARAPRSTSPRSSRPRRPSYASSRRGDPARPRSAKAASGSQAITGNQRL